MKIHYLSLAIAAGLVMRITPTAAAITTVLRSPEVAQTYADNSILWHQLRWLPASQTLVASITFSNLNYVSTVEPRHDESFNFPLPGVKFDAKGGIFYLPGAHSQTIPVATVRHEIVGDRIYLLPTARAKVTNRDGRVALQLVASTEPLPGPRWSQR